MSLNEQDMAIRVACHDTGTWVNSHGTSSRLNRYAQKKLADRLLPEEA